MTNVAQIKHQITFDRIIEAISLDKEFNTHNNLKFPCSICNLEDDITRLFYILCVKNGLT